MKKAGFLTSLKNSQTGQLSIFLGISLVIVITLIGFIINVGLFVKAKINLQNAVDAAAWSGAAVQARQLSNIAFLNWEMRNNYKEWMFKYYVLGQRGVERIQDGVRPSSGALDFRLGKFNNDSTTFDAYNFPSICIHYGSVANICGLYDVPGLPRFEVPGLPSISEHHKAFVDAIVAKKAEDCSIRSSINMGAAMLWAYGTGTDNLFADIPEIAADRPGAWIQALELAMRMRNLEMIVNRPPVDQPICAGGGDCLSISSLDAQNPRSIPINERPIKAFMSAFRNLGGGSLKETDEFAKSFKLTELKPTPYRAGDQSLSNFLIPPDAQYGPVNGNAREKHYLDLQPYPLNLVTFFTSFITKDGVLSSSDNTRVEGACNSSKTALPVPGFILGFVKNPQVLTYYAVKGEANFVGMFFPFTETQGIKLKAYAAAKPFGGRIGPMLFSINDDMSVAARGSSDRLSFPYISGFDIHTQGTSSQFKSGDPIPMDLNFWVQDIEPVGALPGVQNTIKFAIPNLLYDFADSGGKLEMPNFIKSKPIQTIKPALSANITVDESAGLYDAQQFGLFAKNQNVQGKDLSPEDIKISLNNVRKPTLYEALNYLIPSAPSDEQTNDGLDLNHVVQKNENGQYEMVLYAPLYGENTLYQNPAAVSDLANNYIDSNKPAIQRFLGALESVANSIRAMSASRSGGSYDAAANTIHSIPLEIQDGNNKEACLKISMAAKFHQFFEGQSEKCEVEPLKDRFVTYLTGKVASDRNQEYGTLYKALYTKPQDVNNTRFLTAYRPGERQGASVDADISSPLVPGGDSVKSKRNFYSTKFVAMDNLTEGDNPYERVGTFIERYEGDSIRPPDDLRTVNIRNLLQRQALEEFGDLNH